MGYGAKLTIKEMVKMNVLGVYPSVFSQGILFIVVGMELLSNHYLLEVVHALQFILTIVLTQL